jgi:hypothetical protein
MEKNTDEAIYAGSLLLLGAAILLLLGWYTDKFTNESGQIFGIIGIFFVGWGGLTFKNPEKYGNIAIKIINAIQKAAEKSANQGSGNKTETNITNNEVNGDLTSISNLKNSKVFIKKEKTDSNNTILKINKEPEPVACGKPIRMAGNDTYRPYTSWRIAVENMGGSAAKGCKGYIVTDKSRERICWTIPNQGQRSKTTINVEDIERLDFCAFNKDVKDLIYFPTENGWPPSRRIRLTEPNKLKLLVTSENAKPVEANVTIDIKQQRIEIE